MNLLDVFCVCVKQCAKMLPTIESICCSAKTYLVIFVVVLVAVNTPLSVAQGDPIVLNKPPNHNHTKSYEEFYIEHTIAKKDAKQSFHDNYKTLMHGEFSEFSFVCSVTRVNKIHLLEIGLDYAYRTGKRPSWCMECTPQIEHYCRTDMLKDHCCCDARHGKGMPTIKNNRKY